MKKPVKRALLVHSLCAVGKASLTNILPILSLLEVEACPIPSIVLSSHTGGFKEIEKVDTSENVRKTLISVEANNIESELIFIGYLGGFKDFDFLENYIEKYRGRVVLDPILGDNKKLYNGFKEENVEQIRRLIKGCYLITPNITEALFLTGTLVEDIQNISREEIELLCKKLQGLGAENVIITSIENRDEIGVAIYSKERLNIYYRDKVDKSYPGTGDIFTAIVVGNILKEKTVEKATIEAMDFLYETIKMSSRYDYPTREGVLLEKNLYRLLKSNREC